MAQALSRRIVVLAPSCSVVVLNYSPDRRLGRSHCTRLEQ
jgi:hypothetical protein